MIVHVGLFTTDHRAESRFLLSDPKLSKTGLSKVEEFKYEQAMCDSGARASWTTPLKEAKKGRAG